MLLGKSYYRLGDYKNAQEFFERSNYKIADLTNAEAYEIDTPITQIKTVLKVLSFSKRLRILEMQWLKVRVIT
ncbi:MAG: hypothetical protein R2852_03850 [Bacteroidia bacterium]